MSSARASNEAGDEQPQEQQSHSQTDPPRSGDESGDDTDGDGEAAAAAAPAAVDTSQMSADELRRYKRRERDRAREAERRALRAAGVVIKKKPKPKASWSRKRAAPTNRHTAAILQQSALHASLSQAEATTAESAAAAASSPSKRTKHAHHGDGDDTEADAPAAGPSSSFGTPSPSVWSVLADVVYLPIFIELVHAHLATTRSVNINFHILASAFRQKLTERGWAKDAHYVLHGALPPEEGEGAEAATAAAASSSSHANARSSHSAYLTKSKRSVSDFTPTVCQQLWRLIAYHRDPSPQAAMEMLAAGKRHRHVEERCRQLAIPLQVGGKWAAPPQGEALQLERMYGLPPGGAEVTARKQPGAAAAAAATPDAGGVALPATVADAVGDDDSDVEETFEYWPGLYPPTQNLHGSQHSLDGATIDRWAKGWHAHVPPPPPDAVRCCPPHEEAPLAPHSPEKAAATAAVSAALGDPSHPHHAPVQQLSSRGHLAQLCNESRRHFRTQLARNHLYLDLSTGEWTEPPSVGQVHQKAAQIHAVGPPPPMWSSPGDDFNFLDAILDWLQRQPKPTAQTFRASADGGASALLPQATSDWLEIRHACSAHEFPVGFLRRRWWVLCNQSNLFELADHAGNISRPYANPSVERLSEKVGVITQLLTERFGEYTQQQQAALQQQMYLRAQQQAMLQADAQQQLANMMHIHHHQQQQQQQLQQAELQQLLQQQQPYQQQTEYQQPQQLQPQGQQPQPETEQAAPAPLADPIAPAAVETALIAHSDAPVLPPIFDVAATGAPVPIPPASAEPTAVAAGDPAPVASATDVVGAHVAAPAQSPALDPIPSTDVTPLAAPAVKIEQAAEPAPMEMA